MTRTRGRFLTPIFAVLLMVSAFLVYWFGMAPGVVWEPANTGTLLASLTQPKFFSFSSSPLYFAFGFLWSRLGPVASLAFKANLISVLLATLGVVLVYLVILRLTQDYKPALFGGFCLMLLPDIWYFALFANYYILAFFLLWLALISLFWFGGRPRWAVLLSSFFAALSFSSFPLAIFLLIPLGVFVYLERKKFCLLDILAGTAVFVLPLFAIYLVGVFCNLPLKDFISSLLPLKPPLPSSWQNVISFASTLSQNHWWLLWPLAALGLLFGDGKTRSLVWSLGSLFLVAAIYPLPGMAGAYLPAFSVIVVWAALGFKVVWDLVETLSDTEIGTAFENRVFVLVFRLRKEGKVLRFMTLGLLGILALSIPFRGASSQFASLSRRRDTEAASFGSQAWRALPAYAVVLVEDADQLSVLRYFEAVDRSKDVLVTSTSLGFDGKEGARIQRFYPEVHVPPLLDSAETSAQALVGLREFVLQNPSLTFFFALSRSARGGGDSVGEWGGLSLIAEGPLYRVER